MEAIKIKNVATKSLWYNIFPKDVMCYFEQILEAASHKTATV